MVNLEAIQKAISAHAGWKARLRTAINSGCCETPAATVKPDNLCEFGKWLYGSELTAVERQSGDYIAVRQLHRQFHEEAAKVVGFATSGRKKEAEDAVSATGGYTKASSALTQAMIKWRDSIQK